MADTAGLGVWIRILRKHGLFLGGVTLASGVVALGVAFLVPKTYEARATILPPHQELPPVESLNGLETALRLPTLSPLARDVSLSDVYLAILESETVARSLIARFDLQKRYKQKTLARTLSALASRTDISMDYTRLLEVKVRDKEPKMAADLANAYLEELDRVFRETRTTAGMRQRKFLETRTEEARAGLDSLDAVLARVEAERGISALSRDLTEAALVAGNLMGQRLALGIRLQMFDDFGMHDTPARRELELELKSLETEVARLPQLGADVARLLRDSRIREVLYVELNKQLEVARIEEAKDISAVDVLDPAIPPDRHLRPRKGLAAVAGAMAGFGLAFAGLVHREARE